MENSFGKTFPEDIKNQFIRQHIKHWSDLGYENNLSSIPDDVQHGKSLNWRKYQPSKPLKLLLPSRLGKKPMSTKNGESLEACSERQVRKIGLSTKDWFDEIRRSSKSESDMGEGLDSQCQYKHIVHVRGLPYLASEGEISQFFAPIETLAVRIIFGRDDR